MCYCAQISDQVPSVVCCSTSLLLLWFFIVTSRPPRFQFHRPCWCNYGEVLCELPLSPWCIEMGSVRSQNVVIHIPSDHKATNNYISLLSLYCNVTSLLLFFLQLDSNSFFHDLVPGVDNDGSGIVVALAAAKALGALKRNVSFIPLDFTQNFNVFIISFFAIMCRLQWNPLCDFIP